MRYVSSLIKSYSNSRVSVFYAVSRRVALTPFSIIFPYSQLMYIYIVSHPVGPSWHCTAGRIRPGGRRTVMGVDGGAGHCLRGELVCMAGGCGYLFGFTQATNIIRTLPCSSCAPNIPSTYRLLDYFSNYAELSLHFPDFRPEAMRGPGP